MKNQKDLELFLNKSRKDLEKLIHKRITDKDIISVLEGGKRLRPLLSHLTYMTCTQGKNEKYEKSIECSLTIELAHSASLVHDDVIDQDVVRRGKKTYYRRKNVSLALLLGHKMITMGLKIAMNHGKKFADLYIETWDKAVNGAIDEVNFNVDIKESKHKKKSKIFDIYNRIIIKKTASLFSSACKAGAIEAQATKELSELFEKYGEEIGFAYQIADDLIDLKEGEMVDSVIVPLFNRLNINKTVIESPNLDEIKKTLEKHSDRIEKIFLKEIKKHVKKAEELAVSDTIPDSNYKKLLKILPKYIINKTLADGNIQI